jgi:hypothetical protein
VADFLLLTKNDVRTEMFAQRITDSTGQRITKFGRRVVLNPANIWGKHGEDQQRDDVGELRISEMEMAKELDETRVTKCFYDNRAFVEHSNNGNDGQFINLTKMLQEKNLRYLNLSNEFASKLGM